MDLEQFVTPGLGDSSYLVASGDEAVLVDPQRDVGRMLAAAAARHVKVRFVLETHVHNDYVSGALEVRSATGAQVAAPARGGYRFPHLPLAEGDEIRIGSVRLTAMETPGHTPEHLAYLAVSDDDEASEAVFTGGSLIVGSAGRTDLLGPEHAEALARDQYRSLQRLKDLPVSTRVLPTHGAGSFCASAPPSGERSSRIEVELEQNPALAAPDEATFVAQQSRSLLAFPAYYRHMAPINRAGPRVLGADWPAPHPLAAEEVAGLAARGAWIVDGRKREDFAAAHVPGSANIELDDQFASYVGWVVPFGAPVVLVVPGRERETAAGAAVQLLRIGYEALDGYLHGGLEGWVAAGFPVRSYPTATVDDLCEAFGDGRVQATATAVTGTVGGSDGNEGDHLLDVRQQVEWEGGHVPGSVHLFVGDLPGRVEELPRTGELWVACRSGHRAAIAASLADAAGRSVRLVARGGVPTFLGRCPPHGIAAAARG